MEFFFLQIFFMEVGIVHDQMEGILCFKARNIKTNIMFTRKLV